MAKESDLVSLAQVKAWAGVQSSDDDSVLTSLISQVSRVIINSTNRAGFMPASYVEFYNGTGSDVIVLRNWPVFEVMHVAVDGIEIPASPPLLAGQSPSPGWVLEQVDDTPPSAPHRLYLRGRIFTRGVQNVSVIYRAGYLVEGEARTVPASSPYEIPVFAPYGAWSSDWEVIYAAGGTLIPVDGPPSAGEYSVAGGVYTFSAADAGREVALSYGYVPDDLANAAMEWIADRYAHRSRIGIRSKSIGGQETMSYAIGAMPDFVKKAILPYRNVVPM